MYTYVLTETERSMLSLELLKGKSIDYISKKYKLTKPFIKNNLWQDVLNVKCVNLKSKRDPYYEDEMSYGTLTLSYTFDSLSKNEIIAYEKYDAKHKAFYKY